VIGLLFTGPFRRAVPCAIRPFRLCRGSRGPVHYQNTPDDDVLADGFEPDILGLCRYILRMQVAKLPNGPTPSDIRNNTGAIESGDIFGMSDGTTRSKHYSNMRLKDWSYIGATGSSVGIWVVRDNHEGDSGGPFYRSLLNQCTSSNQEITYIVNYGEAQTEAYRTGILNSYTLVATTGAAPGSVDTSWFSGMGLAGYVDASARGRVTGVGINGRDTNYTYTVGFSNSTAQYWTTAAASSARISANFAGYVSRRSRQS